MSVKYKVRNRYKEWDLYDDNFQKVIVSAIIQDQDMFDEPLSSSCQRHNITRSQFESSLGKFDDLLERFEKIRFNINKLSDADMLRLSNEALAHILQTKQVEKIEYRYVDDKWVPSKKTVTDNQETIMKVATKFKEALDNNFNKKIKEITVTAAFQMLKHFTTSQSLDDSQVDALTNGIADFLRTKGVELTGNELPSEREVKDLLDD